MQEDFQRQKDALAKVHSLILFSLLLFPITDHSITEQETLKASSAPSDRFTTRTEGLDEALKKSTIGLVTLEDFRKTKIEIEEAQRREAAQKIGLGDR